MLQYNQITPGAKILIDSLYCDLLIFFEISHWLDINIDETSCDMIKVLIHSRQSLIRGVNYEKYTYSHRN